MNIGKQVNCSIIELVTISSHISKKVKDSVTNSITPSIMESSYYSIWRPVRDLVINLINISFYN